MSAVPSPRAFDVPPLRLVLPWLALVGLLLLLFRDTAAAMVGIWMRSDTFAHAFLVPPICAWLAWRRRDALSGVEVRPAPLVLLPIVAICAMWLLADLAGVNAATQLALVGLLVLSVPAVFGWAVARELAFPLGFLFFAVPIGDFLVAPMMEGTADFTVAALRAVGIPVYREGLDFVIPSGNWSVVEACSGVRYLIASLMVGTLFAYLNFNSTRKRLLFVCVSIAVPIVANWLRAFMIVMLGHLSGNQIAVGADHLVYGWVFFGVVIMIMFLIGSRFADPLPARRTPRTDLPGALSAGAPATHLWSAAALVAVALAGTQGAQAWLDRESGVPVGPLALPAAPAGWAVESEPLAPWTPAYKNANRTAGITYARGDERIGVWVGYYRDQGRERKLVTSTNVLVPQQDSTWILPASGVRTLNTPAGRVAFRSTVLRSPIDPKAATRQRLQVLHVHWVGGRLLIRNAPARLYQALDKVAGRGDDGAVLVFYAPLGEGESHNPALEAFVASQLGTFEKALQSVRAAAPRP